MTRGASPGAGAGGRARALVAALVVAAVLLVGLAAPAGALAHAQLEDVTPQRGAVVEQQPDAVTFRFDEAVEGNFGAVRVFDRAGERVDAGDSYHPDGRSQQIAVHLQPKLPEGTYTATYRVVSADGHVVTGGSTFSIGQASATGATVGELLAGASAGPVTETVLGIGKGLTFAAIAVAVGGVAFLLWTWAAVAPAAGATSSAAAAFSGRVRALLLGAAAAGAVGCAVVVVLQGANAAGISGWSALDPDIVRETLDTRVGAAWGAAVPVWILAGALSAIALRPRDEGAAVERQVAAAIAPVPAAGGPIATARVPAAGGSIATAPVRIVGRGAAPASAQTLPLALLALALAFLVLVPGLGGHASTQSPTWVVFPANVVHVVAMAVWAGGLVVLLAALPAATRRLDPDGRTRLLAGALARFSPLALAAVIALTIGGLVQAYVEVRTPAHLLDTAFGRAVLLKALLLCALIAIGAWHRRASIPRLRAIAAAGRSPAGAGVAVRRALRAEVALIVVVLGVTAALTSYAPSIAQTSGPFSTTTTIGPAQLQLTVDPASVGANEIHLYLLDPRDGSQWDQAEEVHVSATQPAKHIGPLHERVAKAGPGHYVVPAALLGVPGDWTLTVAVRVSEFDQYERRIEVPVR